MKLDHSVYPDLDPLPEALRSPEEKADYLHRICSQWDHGIVPEAETFLLLSQWKDICDRFPVSHSPAYHALRRRFGWEPVPGRIIRATYEIYDLQEGRTDPCAGLV